MRRLCKALSLVEAVVFVSLITVVLLLVFNLFPTSSVSVHKARQMTQASAMAQGHLEQARAQSFKNLKVGLTDLPEEKVGDVTFKPVREVYEVEGEDKERLVEVRVTVHWEYRNAQRQLIETLLAAGLVLLLMSVVFQVLVPSMRLAAASSVRTGLQQQAAVALSRVERAMRRSSDFGVSLRGSNGWEDPTVMAEHRQIDSATPFGGVPQWENNVLVFGWLPQTGWLTERGQSPGVTVDPKHPIARLDSHRAESLVFGARTARGRAGAQRDPV